MPSRTTKFFHRILDPLGEFSAQHFVSIPLRIIVGYGFIQHGLNKLERGPAAFAVILQGLSVPAPHFMAWLNILTELLGGFAILFGAFVTLAAIPLAVVLLVAMVTVHLPFGFTTVKLQAVTSSGPQFGTPGYELNLLYLACLAVLVLAGPSPLSIDAILKKKFADSPQQADS